jgi:hypothetical protein
MRMDWSEILTESEAEYMQGVLARLRPIPWAAPLVASIDLQGGLTYSNKPLLFEARVANALHLAGVKPIEYEYLTGVGDSTVDFRFETAQTVWLAEVVSIGRSEAVEAATVEAGTVELGKLYRTALSSPRPSGTPEERRQSEEGESLLVIQKIGEKVFDKKKPIKFPIPLPGQYHVVIVDMRVHLGGGDIADWKQIAFGAEIVAPEHRKVWLTDDNRAIPVQGVWHPENPMRFAATARERLHAIIFVAEEHYRDGALPEVAWVACNPHLFPDNAACRAAFAQFPLRRAVSPDRPE